MAGAFDRIGDSIVQAMVSGKNETIKWGDIAKSIFASIATDVAKLAIANPIKNLLFGTNAGTLADLPIFSVPPPQTTSTTTPAVGRFQIMPSKRGRK